MYFTKLTWHDEKKKLIGQILVQIGCEFGCICLYGALAPFSHMVSSCLCEHLDLDLRKNIKARFRLETQ